MLGGWICIMQKLPIKRYVFVEKITAIREANLNLMNVKILTHTLSNGKKVSKVCSADVSWVDLHYAEIAQFQLYMLSLAEDHSN